MPVSLQASQIETLTLGGATVFTHDTEAVSFVSTDTLGLQMTVTFSQGTPASNSFATDSRAKTHTLVIDLNTGKYNTSTGLSGTLAGGTLTGLLTNMKNLKNGLESIANNIGLIPGSVVAWT